MPLYRIYRMKDSPRQQFRWAPHVSGCAAVKPKDFECRGEVEAANEYEAWKLLLNSTEPLAVGDLLEPEGGRLRVCKYVGFEPAEWILPETKPHDQAPEATVAAEAQSEPASAGNQ